LNILKNLVEIGEIIIKFQNPKSFVFPKFLGPYCLKNNTDHEKLV